MPATLKNLKRTPKNRLTNAAKRVKTLSSVMIRIPYKGHVVECSTPAEAIEILKHIDADNQRARTGDNLYGFIASLADSTKSAWTRTVFWEFLESLGEAQTHVLTLLVRKQKVTDEELRKALKVESNQALAGVLSGISKQAGALNIPARSVFTVEDERKGGELTKTYAVAWDFLRMAKEMNWPDV
ncbi:MAG TPA: hypothetical protein VGR97_03740 [Candidatus Acidoferrales bacterium]|nr:hypothetical protein [Candidatus Acidoferrales bacterium]